MDAEVSNAQAQNDYFATPRILTNTGVDYE